LTTRDTTEPSSARSNSYDWLRLYRYYLIAVVLLAGIGLGTLLLSIPAALGYMQQVSDDESAFILSTLVILPFVSWLVQIGLFVFAIRSLKRIDERWVRTLHLSINSVAVVFSISFYVSLFWPFPFANIVFQILHVAAIPIGVLVPWNALNSIFPASPGGLNPVVLVIMFLIYTITLLLAAVWWVHWSRLGYSSEAKDATRPIDAPELHAASPVPSPLNEKGTDDPLTAVSTLSVVKSTFFGIWTFAGLIACGVGFYSMSLADGSGGSGIMFVIGIPLFVGGLIVAIPGMIGFVRATASSSPGERGFVVLIVLSCLVSPPIFIPFWIIVFLVRRYQK